MQKINALSNKYIGYIYFIVWCICVLLAFSSCNLKTKGKLHVTGQVIENNTGTGLSGADVYLLATEYDGDAPLQYPISQISSDVNGYYNIEAEANEGIELCIEVHKKGYAHNSSSDMIIKNGATNCINIKLSKVQK